jgi:hypothetical protein
VTSQTASEDNSTAANDSALFSSLVWRLVVETRAFLGEQLHPDVERIEPQLPMAARSIDTLQMLKARTEGRRSEAESELLDGALYQLRLDYVAAQRQLAGVSASADEPRPNPPADPAPPPGHGNQG